jgi:hypothetical protein
MNRQARAGAYAAAAIATAMVAGCASMNVRSFVDRGVDLGFYQTFDWGPQRALSTGDPRLDNNPFFHEHVRRALEMQLAARGFERTTGGTPDLLVHYHASVMQKLDIGAGDAGCDDCQAQVYDQGTLVVDLIDAGTKRLVWRGWAEGSIDGVIDNQVWMEARIDEAVARILEHLPRTHPGRVAATFPHRDAWP